MIKLAKWISTARLEFKIDLSTREQRSNRSGPLINFVWLDLDRWSHQKWLNCLLKIGSQIYHSLGDMWLIPKKSWLSDQFKVNLIMNIRSNTKRFELSSNMSLHQYHTISHTWSNPLHLSPHQRHHFLPQFLCLSTTKKGVATIERNATSWR